MRNEDKRMEGFFVMNAQPSKCTIFVTYFITGKFGGNYIWRELYLAEFKFSTHRAVYNLRVHHFACFLLNTQRKLLLATLNVAELLTIPL